MLVSVHPELVEGPTAQGSRLRRWGRAEGRKPCAVHPFASGRGAAVAVVLLALIGTTYAEPNTERQQQLVRMVRQDCGSCHGMRLTGGLGPALTREAMGPLPVESIAATIFHGRPGTPMPPWRAMLDEGEARWIAQRLQAGFPDEVR